MPARSSQFLVQQGRFSLSRLVALQLRRSVGSPLGYAGVLSLALVAATPAVIIKTGLEVLGTPFPFLELLILALAFGYVYLGLNASAEAATIEGAGESGTTPN